MIYRIFAFPILMILSVLLETFLCQIFHSFSPRIDFIVLVICLLVFKLNPDYISLFVIGVIQDVIHMNPLGMTSLLWVIFSYFLFKSAQATESEKFFQFQNSVLTFIFAFSCISLICFFKLSNSYLI